MTLITAKGAERRPLPQIYADARDWREEENLTIDDTDNTDFH
jgi:hypothetical protein